MTLSPTHRLTITSILIGLAALLAAGCTRPPVPITPAPTLTALTPIDQALDSYRTRGDLRVITRQPDKEDQEEVLHYETDWKKAGHEHGFDLAARMTDRPASDAEAAQERTISIAAVGDDAFLGLGDQGVTMARSEAGIDALPAIFAHPGVLVPPTADLQFTGEEVVNGIPTLHYTFDNPAFFEKFFAHEDADERGSVQTLTGELWVAKDGLYVVKLAFDAEVKDRMVQDDSGEKVPAEQTLAWDFELFDINASFPITLPEDSLANANQPAIGLPGFEPGSLLAPPGSALERTTGPFAVLSNERLTADEIASYFAQRFEELGWQRMEGESLVWILEEYKLTMLVRAIQDGGTRVMLSVESSAGE